MEAENYKGNRFYTILIIAVAAAMVGVMIYSTSTGRKTAEQYAPLIDAAMEIKLEATTAHLWFEEVISGDRSIGIEEIWRHIDMSEWYANTMLRGGANQEGRFVPLDDPGLRRSIEETLENISKFRAIAQTRWQARSESGIGSDIDQEFDLIFAEFIKSADDVETVLQENMRQDIRIFRWTQIALMGGVILLAFAVGAIIRRYQSELIAEHEKTLRGEQNLKITLSSIGDAVISTDISGRVVMMNPIAEKLTEWPLKRAMGKKVTDVFNIVNSKTGKQAPNPIDKVLKNGKTVGLANHTTLVSRLGKKYHISDSAAPIVNEKKDIQGVVMVFRDITQAYHMREAIEKSEERFRMAFDTSPDAININRLKDGMYIEVNKGFTRLMGYAKEEVIGKTSLELDIWENTLDRKRLVDGLQKTGFVENLEAKFITKDGEIRYGLMSARMLQLNGENTILSITRDITSRKHSELKLIRSENKYRTLFEKSNDAIFILNKASGKFIDANQAAEKLTGRSTEELKTASILHICSEDVGRQIRELEQLSSAADLGEVRCTRPDGDVRTAALSFVPLERDKLIGIARDITFEKLMESQIRQSQKMEAIGALAGGIAHDFNNILSGIFGYAQLAKENLKNTEKTAKNIDQVITGAQRAAELVQQILTFSRQSEYKKKPFPIFSIVKEALKLMRSSIPSSIDIKTHLQSQSMIHADPIKIHQIVMNLCTNAYQAMKETGGTLTVSLSDVDISKHPSKAGKEPLPGKYLLLEVVDTGIGMDRQTLEKAFLPYFTTKKAGEGTGLGLALVHAITEEHNGFLDVFSAPGTGTRFKIYFPIVQRQARKEAKTVQRKSDDKGDETIMIADDEEQIREVYAAFFKSYGYRVELHSNGLSALEAFKQRPCQFDILITDLTMPGMTGDKLAREILKINSEFPIILCTGFSDYFNNAEAEKMGIKYYLKKPISPHTIVRAVRSSLDEKEDRRLVLPHRRSCHDSNFYPA